MRAALLDRFMRYVKIHTESDPRVAKTPSTRRQFDLARQLVAELEEIGMEEVYLDENAYVMATLPATVRYAVPTLGLIAHLDTSPDFTGENVKPQLHENYDGGDLVLNRKENIVLCSRDFPEIRRYVGQTLITSDGTTLLGADDKAGIAEIVSAMAHLSAHQEIPHGRIRVAFTPDEEIGRGALNFDLERFGADWAYTVDGGELGELQYENFNAARAEIRIRGRSVHPGAAKDKMVNALGLAEAFSRLLPADEVPEQTEGYQGFFHHCRTLGIPAYAELEYLIRDYDTAAFEARKARITQIATQLNAACGADRVSVMLSDQYYNMKEKIQPVMQSVTLAKKAFESAGVKPKIRPVRGGTDGALLSHRGLPTPNLFAGGHNFHGPFEYIPLESMEKATAVLIELAHRVAEAYAKV